jgi:ethanolamine ammonia-lyase small subunit
MSRASPPQTDDRSLWTRLRQLTAARIGLARSGASLATSALLDFQLAHARARDAVWEELDAEKLKAGLAACGVPVVTVASAATDRQQYLMRPDLGRHLAPESLAALSAPAGDYDVVFIVSAGLSARAVQAHAAPVLTATLEALRGWRVAPLVIVRFGRVAIGDAVAAALGAACAVVLIGERPGLSAPDSMGAYLTWAPTAQTNDAERNCISNIHAGGFGNDDAARKITRLLTAMRQQQLSGVGLKDPDDRIIS